MILGYKSFLDCWDLLTLFQVNLFKSGFRNPQTSVTDSCLQINAVLLNLECGNSPAGTLSIKSSGSSCSKVIQGNLGYEKIKTKKQKIGKNVEVKMSSGFPSDVLRLLCLSAAFYLRSCHQQRPTAAAAASVCKQPTCCFQEPP